MIKSNSIYALVGLIPIVWVLLPMTCKSAMVFHTLREPPIGKMPQELSGCKMEILSNKNFKESEYKAGESLASRKSTDVQNVLDEHLNSAMESTKKKTPVNRNSIIFDDGNARANDFISASRAEHITSKELGDLFENYMREGKDKIIKPEIMLREIAFGFSRFSKRVIQLPSGPLSKVLLSEENLKLIPDSIAFYVKNLKEEKFESFIGYVIGNELNRLNDLYLNDFFGQLSIEFSKPGFYSSLKELKTDDSKSLAQGLFSYFSSAPVGKGENLEVAKEKYLLVYRIIDSLSHDGPIFATSFQEQARDRAAFEKFNIISKIQKLTDKINNSGKTAEDKLLQEALELSDKLFDIESNVSEQTHAELLSTWTDSTVVNRIIRDFDEKLYKQIDFDDDADFYATHSQNIKHAIKAV
ncbi:expressed protein [Phakopsora pachyrhizi]|uniref:Expressed protein n=1 Tax=Phakopsora pachyrhizi TaxID=170000 RepID=A0AAV0AGV4_PHAPC|nr:expressed protein [Phakopsora pachyrhizi]